MDHRYNPSSRLPPRPRAAYPATLPPINTHFHPYASTSWAHDPHRRPRSETTENQLAHDQEKIELVPEQKAQISNIKNFTPSCSRCRQKKLKCDTKLPCNQCTSKGIQHECRKDARVPRGRKRPKSDSVKPQDEIETLKRRIQQLERQVQRQESPVTTNSEPSFSSDPQSSWRQTTSHTSTAGPSESGSGQYPPRPTLPIWEEEEEPGDTEIAVNLLEKLAASDPRIGEPGHGRSSSKKINHVRDSRIAPDGDNSYYTRPSSFNEGVADLKRAREIIPEPMIVEELVSTFNLRCHNLVGRIIHMPSFLKDVHYFNSATPVEIMTSSLNMFDLARYLMVLRLGLRFYPWKGGIFTDQSRKEFIAVNALKNRGDDVATQWRDLAKKALATDKNYTLDSLTAIQAALLMVLDGRDSPTFLRMLLRISIQTALDMGLHRLGKAEPSLDGKGEDLVRMETGVRVWWYLVVKDWCSAQREGAYTIHPAQMTTRKPLHTTDERLSVGNTNELPLIEPTEMSYVLSQISLSHIIRDSIDLRNEQSKIGGSYSIMSPINRKRMQHKLEMFLVEDLPPFYRLDSDMMKPGVLAVQRCLLHQQSFDILLKLNRRDMASHSGRSSCTMLAEQIVSTQKLLRSVCPVIDGFWVNFLHLFAATLTLTISLMLEGKLDAHTRRQRKERINDALVTMRETRGSNRGSKIIETLLEEEERSWRIGHQISDLAGLTRRIVETTSTLSPSKGASMDEASAADESIIPAFSGAWGDDFFRSYQPSRHFTQDSFYDWILQQGGMQ